MKNELRDAFSIIDYMQRGQITAVEIERFLDKFPTASQAYKSGGIDVTHEDVYGLIRRFNKDKQNGRISLPEFLTELTPKQS